MANKLTKVVSGIPGFDEISHGGVPKGRTTLASGTSGSGKTVFSAQFLYKGVTECGENGVFVTFEETPRDIIKNTNSFGWDIDKLVKENKWAFVDASPDEADNLEVGSYDLGAFLARIEHAIKKVNPKGLRLTRYRHFLPTSRTRGLSGGSYIGLHTNLKNSTLPAL